MVSPDRLAIARLRLNYVMSAVARNAAKAAIESVNHR